MAAADVPDHTLHPQPRRTARPRAWTSRFESLTTPGGLLLVSVMIISALPVTKQIQDPDFWWHLRTGQLILENHWILLGTDPYTYTVASHQWTMHEWLTEVLFALWYRIGGLGLIVAVLSVVTWLGIVCLLLRARLRPAPPLVVSLGLLIGVVAAYPIWGPRAQMITFALSCLVLWLMERYVARGGRCLWALPPIFLLWSNLHSGFIVGLGFALVIILAELGGRLLGFADPAPLGRVRDLGIAVGICALVAMINPNGPSIVLYPFATQGSTAQQELILEWHSPDFHTWEARGFAVMLISLLAVVIVNRRIRARDAALTAITAGLAFQSVRHIALFVAAATPVWIDQVSLLVERHRGDTRSRRRTLPPLGFRVLVLTSISLLLLGFYASKQLLPAIAVSPENLSYARDYPVCAARWLVTAPGSLRVFNQYGEGGYLTWRLAGTRDRIFVFGDAALMGDELLYTYGKVEAVHPEWERILRRYGTDLVVFDTGTPLAEVLARSPRWLQVYGDPHNQVFAPRDRVASLHLPGRPPVSNNPADVCSQLHDKGATATP